MKKILSFLMLIFCLAIFRCQDITQPEIPIEKKDVKIITERPFAIISNSIYCDQDKTVLVLQTLTNKDLHIIKFDTLGTVFSTILKAPQLNNALFFQLYIKNLDSIIYFNQKKSELMIIDTMGHILNNVKTSIGLPTVNPENGIIFSGNSIFLGNSIKQYNINKYADRLNYYKNVKPIYKVKLTKDQKPVERLVGDFPNEYVKENYNYHDYFPFICSFKSNKYILSFACDDSIYFYENNTRIKEYKCKSKYINSFTPYPDSKRLDMVFYKKYKTAEPKYLKIVYDKFHNRFFRIAKHRFYNISDNEFDSENMKWSIIIMDSTFKVINEIVFDYRFYTPKVIIPSKDGIYISKTVNLSQDNKNLYLSLIFI